MRTSLMISTYERPDALAAVLRSVLHQSKIPHEVVIGDDGSGPETAELLQDFAKKGLNIVHRWLPHDGFQLARMRNHAAAAATGDYLIITDDDIVLHPEFIADHETVAEQGYFVQGTRVLLGEEPTEIAYKAEQYWPGLLADVGNRKNLLRSALLSRLFSGPMEGLRGIRTCNFAVWREDYVRVNGFNEDFVGWGREDSEFVTRLFNAGVKRRNLKFAALGCHLHHPPRSRDALERNDATLAQTIDAKAVRCERGLNLHLVKKD